MNVAKYIGDTVVNETNISLFVTTLIEVQYHKHGTTWNTLVFKLIIEQ